MAPKIQAAIGFLEAGGSRAIITCPPDLEDAIAGTAGTSVSAFRILAWPARVPHGASGGASRSTHAVP